MRQTPSPAVRYSFSLLFFLVLTGTSPAAEPKEKTASALLTIAERSDYRATARYDEVVTFCRNLAQRSSIVTLGKLGTSFEGRNLPLLILSDPAIDSPEAARKSGKLVVFAMANIHAGEVCGKEALLQYARDLSDEKDVDLLKNLIIVLAPIYNADGNEQVSQENRRNQVGPEEGVGQRANAQGFDLNRDMVKLESPEARALARFLTRWDPAVLIDCHTTNGSYHRYTLTYDFPRHGAVDTQLADFSRKVFLPEVNRRLRDATGYRTFFYGNFDRPHQRWNTYPALPRYVTQYVGLRNRIGILSEAHAYATYRDRVLATREFVRHCFAFCADHKKQIEELLNKADAHGITPADDESPPQRVPIRCEPMPWPKKVTILGYVEKEDQGHVVRTDAVRNYRVDYYGATRATATVARPYAYLIAKRFQAAIETLIKHGVAVDVLREDIRLNVETYKIAAIKTEEKPFQGHRLLQVEVSREQRKRRVKSGTFLVRTDNSLGTLIVNLLEPLSDDSLTTWNFFDEGLREESLHPVMRLPKKVPVLTASLPSWWRPVGTEGWFIHSSE